MNTLDHVSVEREGNVAIITMRRADKRNALSLAMMRELEDALIEVSGTAGVRSVILAGEGPAFSAGHDLRELRDGTETSYEAIFNQCVSLMARVQTIPQPVIAEVASLATAAGCQLVATCDLAVASTQAKFATPGVRIGLFCSTPMVALSRNVGRKRAMEMLLTGDTIDAQTALAWGLVNRVVEPGELRATSLAFASKIGDASGEIVGLGKGAFYRQVDYPQGEAYNYTKRVMTENALLAEAQEGIGAFIDKRRPNFKSK